MYLKIGHFQIRVLLEATDQMIWQHVKSVLLVKWRTMTKLTVVCRIYEIGEIFTG